MNNKAALQPLWEQIIPWTYGWILEVFIIIFLLMSANYIFGRVYKKLLPKLKKSNRVWDDAFLKALFPPLKLFIWFLGLILVLHLITWRASDKSYLNLLAIAKEVGFVLILVWFFTRFIKEVEIGIVKPKPGKRRLDETTMQAISQLLRLTVIITAGLTLMQTFGIPVSGVIAFGGAGGFAVGIAAKDLLANFFGALMIFLDRPFVIGDWIRSSDKEIEGTVEHISWRATRIRTFDKRPLYVPNSVFLNISIENPSRMQNRRIKTNVGLRYQDSKKVATILKDVEEMLKAHPEIDTTKTLFVHLVEFGASSLDFQIYTFTKTTNWVNFQAIQQDVFLKVIEIIHKHEADVAFPESIVNLRGALPSV